MQILTKKEQPKSSYSGKRERKLSRAELAIKNKKYLKVKEKQQTKETAWSLKKFLFKAMMLVGFYGAVVGVAAMVDSCPVSTVSPLYLGLSVILGAVGTLKLKILLNNKGKSLLKELFKR